MKKINLNAIFDKLFPICRSITGNGVRKTLENIKGLISKTFSNNKSIIYDLDNLPFPNWDKFPLEKYWLLGHAHGPLSSKKYLPILSSRGCPYPCNFCVIPKTNERKWRSRTPKNVVDEIKFWQKKLEIKEFHFEDLNSTINDRRTKEICNLIIKEEIKNTYAIMQEADEETAQEFKRLVASEPGAYGIWTAVVQVTRNGYKRKLLWDSIIKNPLDWNLATWTTLQKINDFILNMYPSALVKPEEKEND